MDDLIARIRAAIDEDERAAKAWLPIGNPDAAQRKHIARHDPARVLRQVAAHRKILDLHDQSEAHGSFTYCRACGTTASPCPTLLALAEAYGIEVES